MVRYYFYETWQFGIDHVLPLAGYLLLALLVPRLGRMAVRVVESRLDANEESTKTRLALVGALVYVFEAVAFFLLIIAALANVGVPPLGAAIPATVVSAAVGFGAQKIIGDFLAGFFILTEKQFGVGDYVSFDGVTGVEGTVVSLTLRTTKVRTPTGEVVMVPNGSAGVVTNYSQDWSRAVVDLAVPVHAGETISEITQRVEAVSHRAILDPVIADSVAGELEILPATGLEAPTVAGQPWQVKYRILVVVNPARQWAVERGIRSALLSAFWDHYNLGVDAAGDASALADAAGLSGAPTGADDVEVAVAASETRADSVSGEAGPSVGPGSSADAGDAAGVDGDAATEVLPLDAKDHGPGRPADSAEDQEDSERAHSVLWRDDHPQGFWGKLSTLGGRVRASTTLLFAGLALIGGLLLFSANPEDTDAGWLNPAHWTARTTTTAPEATDATADTVPAVTEPTATVESEPAVTGTAEATPSPEPTATDGAAAGADAAATKSRDERRARREANEETIEETPTPEATPTQVTEVGEAGEEVPTELGGAEATGTGAADRRGQAAGQ